MALFRVQKRISHGIASGIGCDAKDCAGALGNRGLATRAAASKSGCLRPDYVPGGLPETLAFPAILGTYFGLWTHSPPPYKPLQWQEATGEAAHNHFYCARCIQKPPITRL
jgi:hypothetical protein